MTPTERSSRKSPTLTEWLEIYNFNTKPKTNVYTTSMAKLAKPMTNIYTKLYSFGLDKKRGRLLLMEINIRAAQHFFDID